jgi:hypothetical protein
MTGFERYQQLVSRSALDNLLNGKSAFSREGQLNAWVVIWLMIFQRLHAKGTLAVAVRELLTGPVRAFVDRPETLSANTSAYSQGRSKLPLQVAIKVNEWIFQSLHQQSTLLPDLNYSLFLLDGTVILLANTPELVATYSPPRNQHGASHWPAIRVMVAHDAVSGLAMPPAWGPINGPKAVSEQGLSKGLVSTAPAGCAFLGDRNLGVFSMAFHCTDHQHGCLFRLTQPRAKKLNGGVIAPVSGTDRKIRWTPSLWDLSNNQEIPADAYVDGRLVVVKVRDARGKFQKLYFFTTLNLTPEQIQKVYGYRWRIETDLRSLKHEVRLDMIKAKSVEMVGKELVLGIAAYNLTRATMQQAAVALQLEPRQLSYAMAQDTINAFLPVFAHATGDAERQALRDQMLQVFAHSVLPRRRKRRSAPRAIWPRPCPYPKRKVATKKSKIRQCKKVA